MHRVLALQEMATTGIERLGMADADIVSGCSYLTCSDCSSCSYTGCGSYSANFVAL